MWSPASLALQLFWLMRLPCMPVELGATSRQVPEAPLAQPVATAPLPPAPPLPPAVRFPGAVPAPLPPPLAMVERLRYRVDYGVLNIGEIQLLLGGAVGPGGQLVRAAGHGEGAILGFGRLENHVDAEFDAQHLSSRRWTNARRDDGGTGFIRDLGDQAREGDVQLTRERTGAPAEHQRAFWPAPTLDPIGFVLRVRVAPPPSGSSSQVLQVLDGRALWRVTLTNAGREVLPDAAAPGPAIRIEGRAEPIFYSGAVDEHGDRKPREFVLWLSDDPAHVPLRLEVPLGIGDVVVALVEADRAPR